MARNVNDKRSVNRSAKIIEAVLEIGSLIISFSKNDFNTSPIFAGDALIAKPEKNILAESNLAILIFNNLK